MNILSDHSMIINIFIIVLVLLVGIGCVSRMKIEDPEQWPRYKMGVIMYTVTTLNSNMILYCVDWRAGDCDRSNPIVILDKADNGSVKSNTYFTTVDLGTGALGQVVIPTRELISYQNLRNFTIIRNGSNGNSWRYNEVKE